MGGKVVSRRRLGAVAAGVGAGALVASAQPAGAVPPSPWWFNVKDYGAVGDGTADDTAEIQAAINDARAAGGGVVVLPAGTYKVTSTLRLTDPGPLVTSYPTITLQGVGPHATTIKVAPPQPFYELAVVLAAGRDGEKVGIGAHSAGARTVTVPSSLASELVVGCVIGIEATGPAVFGSAKPRELHKVAAISGTTVSLDSPLVFNHTTVPKAWRMYAPVGMTVRDLNIASDQPADSDAFSVRFYRAVDIAIERVTITNGGGGIELKDVVDGHVSDVTIDRLPQMTQPPWGYGINASGSTANLTITGLIGRWCRHVFTTLSDCRNSPTCTDSWGGPRDITIVGGIGEGGPGALAIWDTHEHGTNIRFIGCTARGAGVAGADTYPGFQVRARDVSIIDCVAVRCGGKGVSISAVADNVTVQGGEFAYNLAGIGGDAPNMQIIGAHVHHNGRSGIGWGGPAANVVIQGCYIHDNGLTASPYALHDQTAAGATMTVITGNVIPKTSHDQSMLGVRGTRATIANNVLFGYGPGNLGDLHTGGNVIKSANVTDPLPPA